MYKIHLGANVSKYDVYLTKNEVMNLLIWFDNFDGNLPKPDYDGVGEIPEEMNLYKYDVDGPMWSGRRILSMILPKINLQKNNMVYEDIEDETHKRQNRIKIENGEIIDGVFDKSLLGAKAQGLVHVIFNDYGQK